MNYDVLKEARAAVKRMKEGCPLSLPTYREGDQCYDDDCDHWLADRIEPALNKLEALLRSRGIERRTGGGP